MRRNLLFLSGDIRLVERIETALANDLAVMAIDPRGPDLETMAARFTPEAIIIDAGAHTGTKTILERMTIIRAQFPGLPLIAIGDEMSAQVILAAFRAGVDDFVDRDASDGEIRNTIISQLRARQTETKNGAAAALVGILSPVPSDEDNDLALNIASLIAASAPDRRTLLLDLSLPVTPTRAALGLDFGFTLNTALKDIARLDRTFLESALTRAADTGLYVLPLAAEESDGTPPAPRDLAALLQVLQSLFDTVVVCWGPFSRQAVRVGVSGGTLFVGCNQRFSSIQNAKNFLAALHGAGQDGPEPILVIHQLDTNLMPSPKDIAEAAGARHSLVLRANWSALASAHNRGRPLGLAGLGPYSDALRGWLTEHDLLPRQSAQNATTKLLQWLNSARAG